MDSDYKLLVYGRLKCGRSRSHVLDMLSVGSSTRLRRLDHRTFPHVIRAVGLETNIVLVHFLHAGSPTSSSRLQSAGVCTPTQFAYASKNTATLHICTKLHYIRRPFVQQTIRYHCLDGAKFDRLFKLITLYDLGTLYQTFYPVSKWDLFSIVCIKPTIVLAREGVDDSEQFFSCDIDVL